MRRKINEKTCDHCGKVVQESGIRFGGTPFNGWIYVSIQTGLDVSAREESEFDFCCKHCLLEKFKK